MSLTSVEEKLLKKISKSQLITKNELKNFLKDNGNPSSASTVINSATKSLLEKELISVINPIGSTCFIITKKGGKLLQELE